MEWWQSTVAEPVLTKLIGLAPVRDEQQLHLAVENASLASGGLGLLSPTFLDFYLPSQPNLLFALLLLILFGLVGLLIFLAVLLGGSRLSRFCLGTNDDNKDEKVQKSGWKRSRLLLSVSIFLWLLVFFASILFAASLVSLVSMHSGKDLIAAEEEELLQHSSEEVFFEEKQHQLEWQQRRQRDNDMNDVGEPEVEVEWEEQKSLLKKYEEIRELGYRFSPQLGPFLHSGWTALLLMTLLLLYLATLLFSLLAILIGLNHRFLRHYQPMEDNNPQQLFHSVYFGVRRVQRVRRLLTGTGIGLLFASPLMVALGTLMLTNAHGHFAVCPVQQRMSQEQSIAKFVDQSFSAEERHTLPLPEFLADLAHERAQMNEENCQRERAPLQNLWSSSLLLALLSLPFGLCLLCISACWAASCPEREGSVSLRAYVPGWIKNSALTPDAYSSIPELGNHSGRFPSTTSQSQCSFGTGTFVYKKY